MDIYRYQQILPDVPKLNEEKRVTLLLGTDRQIGRGTPNQETRVCMTPDQVRVLRDWLATLSISLTLYVTKDMGISSGYDDADYLQVGDQCIQEEDLSTLLVPPDVVHALKEPSHYEAKIPGSFIRIGALHIGKFEVTGGCASLLKQKNFCAIFDGSAIGGFSYKIKGGYAIPIRSSMSVFAGKIAADLVLDGYEENDKIPHKVVVVGGGVVGVCAANRILQKCQSNSTRIVLIEVNKERVEHMRQIFEGSPSVQIKLGGHINSEDLNNVSGLILAACRPGIPSPKVVEIQALASMAQGASVVDVSADEGGSISYPQEETVQQALGRLRKTITYIGDTNMPRRYPAEASEAHGKAVLPYLATLLFLSAREGGAAQAVEYIKRQSKQGASNYFEALVCDLGGGLAFRGPDPIGMNEGMVKDTDSIIEFFQSQKICFNLF